MARNYYRTHKAQTLKVTVYNSKTKKEEELEVEIVEGIKETYDLPEGCIEIKKEVVSEKETKYKMTPAQFIEYAEVVEDK